MTTTLGVRRDPTERLLALVLVLALCLSIVPFAAPLRALAADVTVSPGTGLQAAIAGANPGDVLILEAGEYLTSGQVVIDKPLTIVGAGSVSTTVKTTTNTTTYRPDDYATTGWIYVQPGASLSISNLTLDGGSVEAKTVGAAVYAMGPLVAESVTVQNVRWSQYYGLGFVLMGPGHTVSNCVFDSTVQRVGVHVDLAPTGGPAPDPAWDSIPYTATITGSTFTAAGAAANYCQYGVEAGRGGRARVVDSSFSGYRGVAASDGSPSGAILATSYYPTDGSKAAVISVEGCAISDSSYGVTVGYPYQLADTLASVTNTTFDDVDFDLDIQAPESLVSIPGGGGNRALDGFFEYNWVGPAPAFDYVASPPALPAGYCTLIAPAGSNLRSIIHAAADGSTILVESGTFVTDGQVTIDKDLTIVGSGMGLTTVQNGVNTAGTSMTTFATTGWFYVTSAGSLNISDMTLDGGALGGVKTGAGIYAMGPLTADNLHVTQVKYLPSKYVGVGLALLGSGHSVTNSVFDEIGRIGIYVGAAPEITVGDMDPTIEYGAVVDGCTFTGSGAGDYCQYGMEVGRSGRALVTNSDFAQYSGVASSDGSNSACLYVNSYWGVGTSKLVIDTCTFSTAEWGVVAGYPGFPPPSYVPGDTFTDAILSVSRSSFEAVAHDVTADGDIQSTPTGVDNSAPDHDWLYERHDNNGDLVASPSPLAEGFINWFPVGVVDAYNVQKNVALAVPAAAGVLSNDTDANTDELLTAALVDDVQHGSLTLNADGSFAYTPAAGFTGTDGFTYRAADWLDTSAVTAVTLTVANAAPVVVADEWSVRQGQSLVVSAPGVLVNDSDANGDPLAAVLASPAAHGSVLLNPSGAFVYIPDAGYAGADSFAYVANDGADASTPVSVSITVVNAVPVAVADSYDAAKNGLLAVSAPGVLHNDSDGDGDLITAVAVTDPAHGQLVLSWTGGFIYRPAAGYVGPDSFTYRIGDGVAMSAPAVVTINVLNAAPVAVDRAYTTNEDVALVKSAGDGALVGASDPNGDAITAVKVTDPAHGVVTLAANGAFTYTPVANWHGSDSFTFKVNDGDLDSAVKTVSITVSAVNDAPVGVNDSYSVTAGSPLAVPARGVLANDTDVDGDTLSAQLVAGPSKGTLTLNANGSFTYTPGEGVQATSDSFTYRAKDGVALSGVTTVSLTIGASSTSPAALIEIYRFYSPRSGTHFYTPSLEERDMVIATWPDVWNYEGVAYVIDLNKNPQPLYRFYNSGNGSHFYTASDDEAAKVQAKYSSIFSYDGRSYPVTPYPEAGKTPVYRFLNVRNGSHFYTASEAERNHVIATWPDIYHLEGPAFWLGQ